MQSAVDTWSSDRRLLQVADRQLPWMVFFDQRCMWHVAPDRKPPGSQPRDSFSLRYLGRAVSVFAVRHDGTLHLPGGIDVPAAPLAFTAPHTGPRKAFFVVALPEIWRPQWKASDPPIGAFLRGVAAHELAHTLQIAALASRVEALQRRYPSLPKNIDDDIVEQTFKDDPVFVSMIEREREFFYRAAFEPADARARALALRGLEIAAERAGAFFAGPKAPFAELEGLFLNLEGIGTWVSYRLSCSEPGRYAVEERVISTHGHGTALVQGEGFALMLLVDRFAPDWRRRMLGAELASPFDLLREALATSKPSSSLSRRPPP